MSLMGSFDAYVSEKCEFFCALSRCKTQNSTHEIFGNFCLKMNILQPSEHVHTSGQYFCKMEILSLYIFSLRE